MNNFFKKYNRNSKRINFLALIVFAIFSNFSAFAQTSVNPTFDLATDVVSVVIDEVPVKGVITTTSNSNASFIIWFMGTKENPNKVISSDEMCTKKGIISSGAEPNHLLMRTLLKKTVNIKFC